MLKSNWVLVAAGATLVICWLVGTDRLPIDIHEEPWGKIEPPIYWPGSFVAGFATALYLAFVRAGSHWLSGNRPWSRRVAVLALVPCACIVQAALQQPGYGLGKWPFVLFSPASSGYYTAATEVHTATELLAHYDEFQREHHRREGPFHVATHPPGLVLMHYAAIRLCQANPGLTRWLMESQPTWVREGFRSLSQGSWLPPADQASIWLVALASQLASALTVLPLYRLARRVGGPVAAWNAVALWPLVPAVTLFMPKSDVLYPLVATTCVALALGGSSLAGRLCSDTLAGLVLWIGMFFSFGLITLVPLTVLVIALAGGIRPAAGLLVSAGQLAAIAAGVLLPTLLLWLATDHNLLDTWRNCYRIHATFYERVPRTYWPWVAFNLIEFAIALGVPLTVTALVGMLFLTRRAHAEPLPNTGLCGPGSAANSKDRKGSSLMWAWCLTLLALDLSGKNRGEVARLWIFLMPFAVPAAAAALERSGRALWPALLLQSMLALQTIVFASNVQSFFDPRSMKIPQASGEQRSEVRDQNGRDLAPDWVKG